MNWDETICFIRTQPEYKELVEKAYFEEELSLNVERFKTSEEFAETQLLISRHTKLDSKTKLLDIGSGNGISAVAFALKDINVDSIEPDPSDTIGAGAIRKLKEHYNLTNLNIHQAYAEEIKFEDNFFDIVYARQCMHHAYNLELFLKECARVLKDGGVLITVRDHVVYNEIDKEWFLENHPLQKFYGGENAFSEEEYKSAIINSGLKVKKVLKHFDSVINYFPLSKKEKEAKENTNKVFVESIIKNKLGVLSKLKIVNKMATVYVKNKLGEVFDERKVPGRMYTFIAVKE